MTRAVLAVLASLLVLAGCSNAAPTAAPAPTPAEQAPAPVAVAIPSLNVWSTLTRTGLNPDRSPQVPPVTEPGQASWATWSPRPGEPGPAVLYGHVDGEQGGRRGVPGVFHRLTDLAPGDEVVVAREGGSRAVFAVTAVRTWPKAALDTGRSGERVAREVYGDTPGPELRLVSCGGVFDRAARSYDGQVVAFARLARVEQ